jgi:hypothetical protein
MHEAIISIWSSCMPGPSYYELLVLITLTQTCEEKFKLYETYQCVLSALFRFCFLLGPRIVHINFVLILKGPFSYPVNKQLGLQFRIFWSLVSQSRLMPYADWHVYLLSYNTAVCSLNIAKFPERTHRRKP